MASEDFDIESLATYLHLAAAQVVRLAERDILPGRKVGDQGRFSQAEIHHWLEDRIGLSDADELSQVAGALDRAGPTDEATGRSVSRKMKIIARTGAGPDHPVASNCLETDYLKAIWMVME